MKAWGYCEIGKGVRMVKYGRRDGGRGGRVNAFCLNARATPAPHSPFALQASGERERGLDWGFGRAGGGGLVTDEDAVSWGGKYVADFFGDYCHDR